MLFLSVQVSQRRRLAAILFVLVALAAIGGAVALVLTSGGDEEAPEDAAQAPPVAPAGDSGAPAAEAPAGDDSAPAVADVAVPTPYIVPTPAGVRTLMIPKLSETFRAPIPILELPIINRQWDVSGLGYYIGWLDGTTWLEPTWGNTVLAAHVQLDAQTPGPFWGLSKLVPGDEIIVREGEIERVFVVMSTRKVAPDDWTVTAPTDGPTLTLITCTDWSNAYGIFAQRLVVQAIPVT
jgi:LPXTG-site transpeptidase (sortase) family protein